MAISHSLRSWYLAHNTTFLLHSWGQSLNLNNQKYNYEKHFSKGAVTADVHQNGLKHTAKPGPGSFKLIFSSILRKERGFKCHQDLQASGSRVNLTTPCLILV